VVVVRGVRVKVRVVVKVRVGVKARVRGTFFRP
jgi:hypothetical protein